MRCLQCGKIVKKEDNGDWWCDEKIRGCGAWMEYWQTGRVDYRINAHADYHYGWVQIPHGTLIVMNWDEI